MNRAPDIDVAVIGGGLAGLVAAATAVAEPGPRRHVVLFEPHPLGGRARCDDRSGFVFNRGPRALYLGGPGRVILERLGVDVAAGGPPAIGQAYGRRDGRLVVLPQGAMTAVRSTLLSPAEKLRLGWAMRAVLKTDARSLAGRPWSDFVAGMGLPPAAAELVDTIARVSTYAADLDIADAEAVLGNVQLALGEGVRYPDGGFQSLVDQLARIVAAAGVEMRPIPVDRVGHADETASDEAAVGLRTVAGPLTARTVVSAAGTPAAAAELLGRPIAGAQRISAPVTAACLELGLRRPPRHRLVLGVGEPLYLSTHCPPARLAPPGHAVLHVMRYHHRDEQIDALAQRAYLRAAAAQAGIDDDDIVEARFLPHMVVTGGIPLAAGGGLAGRPPVTGNEPPGVLLAGDWVGDVGLLSDAAVASGHAAGLLAAERSAAIVVG
jgi:phytoene dehydrogenase-like protein